MNKIKVLSLLIVLGLFLTACSLKTAEKPNTSENSKKDLSTSSLGEKISGSLNDLLLKGKNFKCTYKIGDQDVSSEGIVYASGKRARSEFEVKGDGETYKMYSIVDGDWMYTWNSNSNKGTKMNYKELEQASKEMAEKYGSSEAQDENKIGSFSDIAKENEYDCTPWVVDSSKFSPPSNITFEDASEMLKGFTEKYGDILEETCKLCDMMPTQEDKDECRAKSCK